MSLTLSGGTVLTSLATGRSTKADVVIDEGRIRDVGSSPSGGERRDCSGCLVIPGNVCSHTHLYSALARGMPFALDPPTDFLSILRRIWWRLDRALDTSSIQLSALVAAAEAALAGTTTLVDHHSSPTAIDGSLDLIADAVGTVGLRSVLCYETSDRDGPSAAGAGLRENERFLQVDRPLAKGMVGAHASFTLSEDTLEGCVDLARASAAGIHIHVAEDEIDQLDAIERFGIRVAHRLDRAGALADASVLAHCVHLDASEMQLIRGAEVTVAHDPTSNMNNGVGRARLPELGPRIALGTDGIGADMFAESRTAYFRAREDDVLTSPGLVTGFLEAGARFAGRAFDEADLGSIAPGAPADLVVLDYHAPTPVEERNIADHWVFGIGASAVRDVVVAGRFVVKDRRLVNVDHGRLLVEAADEARRLWGRIDELAPHPFTTER